MLKQFGNIFKIPDLRKKVLYTLGIILVHRIGTVVTIPFVDAEAVRQQFEGASGSGVLGMVNMFTGGAFQQMSVFALGIMPYISASIIIQLLMVVWPRLEKIAKEGEIGKKKINQYTRYSTVILTAFQAIGIGYFFIYKNGLVLDMIAGPPDFIYRDGDAGDHDRHLLHHVAWREDHREWYRQRYLDHDYPRHPCPLPAVVDPGLSQSLKRYHESAVPDPDFGYIRRNGRDNCLLSRLLRAASRFNMQDGRWGVA